MFNVLITSAGRRSYLVEYFQEALVGSGRVVAANMFADAPAMLVADDAITVPGSHEPEYVSRLLDICRSHEIRMLISAHDLDTAYLAGRKSEFEAIGVRPVIADADFVRIAYDKYLTIDFLSAHEFPICPAAIGLNSALEMIATDDLRFPLIVKPRCGFKSIGLREVHDEQELRIALQQVRRAIQQSPIVRSEGFCLEESVMVQQLVTGPEYGIDVVNDLNGDVAAIFVEKKLAMRSGETDKAIIVEDPLLVDLGERLGRACRHPGVLDVDVIVEDGVPYVLEMNPRFGGHYPFAHMAGANVPAALIAWARGTAVDPSWLTAKAGVWGYKDITPTRGRCALG